METSKKRIVNILTIVIMVLSLIATTVITPEWVNAATTPTNVSLTFEAGTLTVSPNEAGKDIKAALQEYASKNDVTKIVLSDRIVAPSSSSRMFYGYTNCVTIEGLTNLDTSQITNMGSMFSSCSSLKTLDVSNFDTSNVQIMTSMFSDCTSLETLDVSKFDTSNVEYMNAMFDECSALKNLDLSNFSTSKVTWMHNMFYYCSSLKTLDLSNFDTARVTNMELMFYNCSNLQNLDISNFNTANVTTMEKMFAGCSSITTLDLSHFNTPKVTNMRDMFSDCIKLLDLDISSFDTSNIETMYDLFDGCTSLSSLKLGEKFADQVEGEDRDHTRDVGLYTPSKSGYDGTWTDGDVVFAPAAIPNNRAARYYPTYTGEPFTITYDLNGGENNSSNLETYTPVSYNLTFANPTRTGYTFEGWYNSEDYSGETIMGIPLGSTGNKTVYAKWSIEDYTISYELNGGTNSASNPAEYTIESEEITFADPTKLGYGFEGWYDNAEFTGTAVTTIPAGSTEPRAYYAKWSDAIDYDITYELNGGTNDDSNPATYNVESEEITLANPSRAGAAFEGWYENAEFTGTAVTIIPAGSTEKRTFYAKWSIEDYTISYELNGGTNSASNPAEYTVESEDITLADPTKLGYGFEGWYENAEFTGTAVTTIAAGSTEDRTYYAKWSENPIDYDITYELNGGTNNSSNPATYNVESEEITLADPSRVGAIFEGWYDNAEFTGDAVTTIPAGSTEPKTFYAKWSIENYTISYELNGGTNSASNPTKYTVESEKITLADPAKLGYGFEGWYDNAGFTGDEVTTIAAGSTEDRTYYAKWSENPIDYDITYELNGGTNNSSNPATYNVESEEITLADPSRVGAIFEGWYDNAEFTGDAVTIIPAGSTEPKTFYAKWSIEDYTINYELNGGTNSASNPAKYTVESEKITLADPAKLGYGFEGWYDNAGFTGDEVTTIAAGSTEDRTYYAKWSENPIDYDITYELNGGTNNSSNPATYNVESEEITLADPSRVGAIFEGWYDNAEFTGDAVTIIPAGSTEPKTFYAKWSIEDYTINYELNGGTNSASNPAEYTVESEDITLADPAKLGYGFEGWYDNAGFTGDEVTTIAAGSTEDRTYYAKWSDAIDYDITYELNGGTNNSSNPATYNVESEEITLADPSRVGAIFEGWYDNAEFTGDAVTTIPAGSTEPKTFYAKWSIENYTINYELNGGTNSASNPAEYTVESEDITLADPAKLGYGFEGWHDNAGFTGDEVTTIAAGSTEDRTYYAKWSDAIDYDITYELNGGKNADSNPATYNVESEEITLADPSRVGAIFEGWYDNAEFTGDAVTTIPAGSTEKRTFYAKWSIEDYTISYELNGGTNSASNPAEYTVESEDITLADPTLANYTFKGWYDNAVFTGAAVTTIPKGSTEDKTLYAKWEPTAYNIKYNLDGGTNNKNNPSSYTVESEEIILEKPSREGYTFENWYGTNEFTGAAITTIPEGSVGEKNLYAKWIANDNDIVIYASDGTMIASYSLLSGEKIEEPPTPTRAGYVFAGWYYNGEKYNFDQPVTGNVILTETWVKEVVPTTDNKNENSTNGELPSTGDQNNIWIYGVIAIFALLTFIGTIIYVKRKNHTT